MLNVPELRSQFRSLDAAHGAFDDTCIDTVPAALCDPGPAYENHPG